MNLFTSLRPASDAERINSYHEKRGPFAKLYFDQSFRERYDRGVSIQGEIMKSRKYKNTIIGAGNV